MILITMIWLHMVYAQKVETSFYYLLYVIATARCNILANMTTYRKCNNWSKLFVCLATSVAVVNESLLYH